ncbi:HD domain-containing protein [Ohtaekwangia sp.]|uniref:HD domain-containing protein n=1 Tax=Ohtaekwangia sp. TaxID=2066019 RepID=UPI002FDCA1B8
MSLSVLLQTEQFVRALLERSLDKHLYYHNISHTVEVVRFAAELARQESLSPEETEIVLLAAWFHDTGFTVSYIDHERESTRIASQFLSPWIGADQISQITDCIMVTCKGSIPANTLQSIMHDADYGHFFKPDYFAHMENLREEVAVVFKQSFTNQEWYEMNSRFLSNHHFYTTVCQRRWAIQKNKLLAENAQMLRLQR